MAGTIPLRRIVLYKHGVGFFIRRGTVAERELALPFRANEVDDALKSLATLTIDGGQVLAIHYQTVEDREQRLANIPLDLSNQHSLFDLLSGLRGASVSVKPQGRDTIQGRVVGVEQHPQGKEHGATLVILTQSGAVEQLSTDAIEALHIQDQHIARELDEYLDASLSEESWRTVRIELDQPGREVQVAYTVPSPVWRVSYRLIAGTGEGAEGEEQALLQGWGIFDNRSGEDLEDVEVTLVAGQPVSFRYDLTSSVIPQRPFVRDEARLTAGPIEFDAAIAEPASPRYALKRAVGFSSVDQPAPVAPTSGPEERPRGMDPSAMAQMQADQLLESTRHAAEGQDLDELFEYRVTGVSVKRGESAMVPVVRHIGAYRRVLLYNPAKQPRHPAVSLRLPNSSGLTLERGPVTIIENGDYRGEAILPFTRKDGEIVLAYAVELGITVREDHEVWIESAGLHLEGAYALIQQHRFTRVTYTLVNETGREQTVTVEQNKGPQAEIVDTREPDEETLDQRRWDVACPPGKTTFEVTLRQLLEWRESLLDQHLDVLAQYLESHTLDRQTRTALQQIMQLRQTVHDLDRQREELQAERRELGERQDRLRQNLSIQAGNEQEQEIRRRSAESFRQTQDREAEIEAELARIQDRRRQTEEQLQTELAGL